MNRIHIQGAVRVGALLLVAGLAGCASTTEIDALRAEVRQATEAAENAAASAEAARREAAAASAAAADAKATAEATDTKIDRMFKKTMYK